MTTAPVSRQRWLIPVVVVVVSVTVGGGLLAREFYQRQESLPRQPEQVVESTSTAPLAPAQQPGSDEVKMTPDVANHPQGEAVRKTVQAYFTAINTRDYQLWRTAVTAERQRNQPAGDWADSFKSTKDGSILIYRIERGGGDSLRVLVGFTSTQNLAEAPKVFQEKCIRWRVVLPMQIQSTPRIGVPATSELPEHDKC